MQTQVDAGRDASRGGDGTFVDEALASFDADERKLLAQVVDVFPMGGDTPPIEQPHGGEQERARTNGRSQLRLGARLRDPLNHARVFQLPRHVAAGHDEHVDLHLLTKMVPRLDVETTARTHDVWLFGDSDHPERRFRSRALLHPRSRGEHLERPRKVEHLDFVEQEDGDSEHAG